MVEAWEYLQRFEPKDGVDYGPTLAYAKDCYTRTQASHAVVEAKALALMTYLGGGIGVASLVAIAGMTNSALSGVLLLSALPTLAAAGLTVSFAAAVRNTEAVIEPMTVPAAVDLAVWAGPDEGRRKKTEGEWAAYWAFAETCEVAALLKKTRALDSASKWFQRSLFCLLLPVAALGVWKSLPSSPPPATEVKVEMVPAKP